MTNQVFFTEAASMNQALNEILRTAEEMQRIPEVDTFTTNHVLPPRFFDLLDRLYEQHDRLMGLSLEEERVDVICRQKCDACCYQNIDGIYSFETVNMYREIKSGREFTRLFKALEANARASDDLLFDGLEKGVRGDQIDALFQRTYAQYASLKRPCAFLSFDNCKTYDARPIPCRNFFATKSPELCATSKGTNFRIELPDRITDVLLEISKRMMTPQADYFPTGLVRFAQDVMGFKALPGYE